ncbi:MAG: HNH endonuclease [Actinobacteria bacterium]|nr:HNH endonuclease [Actinomycetota bacterium]
MSAGYRRGTPFERTWNKFLVDDGCWLWTASIDADGYGRLGKGSDPTQPTKAHVVLWNALRGPVPEGMELDHLCQVKHCVNPAHLEPTTHLVNCQRRPQYQSEKTHCPQGHPYDEENTYDNQGRRHCRACMKVRNAKYEVKRKERRHGQSSPESA